MLREKNIVATYRNWCFMWPVKGDAACGVSLAQIMFILTKDDFV